MEFKIHTLGIGSALSKKHDNSSFLLSFDNNGKELNYLFDCGNTVPKIWHRKFNSVNLDGIIVSHQHPDHAGGIEEIAFYNKFVNNKKTSIYTNQYVWTSIFDNFRAGIIGSKLIGEDFFDFHLQNDMPEYFKKNIWIKTLHISELYHSYGFAFEIDNLLIWISGDTQFNSVLFEKNYWQKYFKKEYPDIILHEASFHNSENNVHTFYDDLNKLSWEIKQKIILYHIYDCKEYKDVRSDGFLGYAPEVQPVLLQYDTFTKELIVNTVQFIPGLIKYTTKKILN